MRGFVSGAIWGLVVSAVGLSALSLLSPVGPSPDVRSEAPETGSTSAPGETGSGVTPPSPDPQVVETAPTAPETPQGDTGSPGVTGETAGVPEVSQAPTAPSGATSETATESVTPSRDEAPAIAKAPEAPGTVAEESATPEAETRVEIPEVAGEGPQLASTAPGTDAGPEVPAVTGGEPETPRELPGIAAPGAETAPEAVAAPPREPVTVTTEPVEGSDAPEADAAPELPVAVPSDSEPESRPVVVDVPAAETAPDVSAEPAAEPAPETEAPVEEAAPAPEAAPQPTGTEEESPRIAALPQTVDVPDTETAPDAAPEPEDQAEEGRPRVAALPQAGATDGEGNLRPTIGKRVVPLTDRGKEGEAQPDLPDTDGTVAEDLLPLERYAAPFDNPDDKPMMAIVLIDDSGSMGVEALKDFPYPLTFAIDPEAPDAVDKMARRRAAGFEVVAMIDLPELATAQDAEVALAASFSKLDEALAILEGTGTGIQGNRDLSVQVAAFAGHTGRGLITQGSGLNTVQKLALREGVKALPVFRDFDGAGQTPTVMRRFLDQAAFRAGQEGGVVMLGRVRPETISALLIWGLQDRASRVALAPVSALLNRVGEAAASSE